MFGDTFFDTLRLQRDATVELWGKEKQKILDKASER